MKRLLTGTLIAFALFGPVEPSACEVKSRLTVFPRLDIYVVEGSTGSETTIRHRLTLPLHHVTHIKAIAAMPHRTGTGVEVELSQADTLAVRDILKQRNSQRLFLAFFDSLPSAIPQKAQVWQDTWLATWNDQTRRLILECRGPAHTHQRATLQNLRKLLGE
jgi:hypothetical protein